MRTGRAIRWYKDLPGPIRRWHIALVAATLLASWLVTHTLFALRYAHEYYERGTAPGTVQGGLAFPGNEPPDYWDFVYFAFVLGMTFQVSDVQITSRKLRRLATVHGVVSFAFNTVIVALTVNMGSPHGLFKTAVLNKPCGDPKLTMPLNLMTRLGMPMSQRVA